MKYLIYKGTGGLVHMLNGLQSSVELSKKENRKSVSKPIPLDPDSPFALLAGLKEQLKSQK